MAVDYLTIANNTEKSRISEFFKPIPVGKIELYILHENVTHESTESLKYCRFRDRKSEIDGDTAKKGNGGPYRNYGKCKLPCAQPA